jgi:hypothetical protein
MRAVNSAAIHRFFLKPWSGLEATLAAKSACGLHHAYGKRMPFPGHRKEVRAFHVGHALVGYENMNFFAPQEAAGPRLRLMPTRS